MLKMKIFQIIIFLKICFSQIKVITSENELRSLSPKSADKVVKNEDNEDYKLLQTLYSDSYSNNYYYATLYIGPKKVKQSFIVDTGIALMSSLCVPCEYCGPNKAYYFEKIDKKVSNPLKCGSNICQMIPATGCNVSKRKKDKKSCSFYGQKQNGDGLRGYFLKNVVYFEEAQNVTSPTQKQTYRSYALPMGCTLGEYGMYKEIKADGVMGINNEKTSFISLLYNLKIIKKNIFSLCFGLEGGYMSLGDIDTTFHRTTKINYIPLLNSTENYLINIKGISLGKNNPLPIIKMNASIDSGSPLTSLPRHYYKILLNDFLHSCKDSKGKKRCGNFSKDDEYGYCAPFKGRETLFKTVNEYWPVITLELDNNTKYYWKPINYFYYYIKGNDRKACFGFKYNRNNRTILGSNFMRENDFIFDREQKLLGFVPADCSRKNLMMMRKKGILQTPSTDPVLVDKEIHKNETEGKFNLGDNTKKEEVRFIEGQNKELDNIDFNLINFLVLSLSILMVVVVLIVVIVYLMCNKNKYSKYQSISEETNKFYINQNNNVIEEINDT